MNADELPNAATPPSETPNPQEQSAEAGETPAVQQAGIPPVDANAIPAPSMPGPESFAPPRSLLEEWIAFNRLPLLVIMGAITALILNEFGHGILSEMFGRPARSPMLDTHGALAKLDVQGPGLIFMGSVLLIGVLAWLVAALIWVLAAAERPKLRGFLAGFQSHTRPALNLMDFIAICAVWFSALRILATAFFRVAYFEGGELMAAGLLLNDCAMVAALLVAILIARTHAGGPRGSSGIWPFWTQTAGAAPRSVWADIALGLASYPLCLWIINAAAFVNQALNDKLGISQDQHVLITELAKPQPAWVIGVFVFFVTVGAAFFEEIFFRGILYNILRRRYRLVPAAIITALVFSSVHFVWSNFLGLCVLGLLLTWLYERTGRLVASMTLHATNNLVSLILVLLYSKPGN